jgi:hypothetical protein
MRRAVQFAELGWPVLPPLALVLSGLAPVVAVAGLALASVLVVPRALVLALSALLSLTLAPFILASGFWPGWRWLWLGRPSWFREPWPWLCRSWPAWPWLCWTWLR